MGKLEWGLCARVGGQGGVKQRGVAGMVGALPRMAGMRLCSKHRWQSVTLGSMSSQKGGAVGAALHLSLPVVSMLEVVGWPKREDPSLGRLCAEGCVC